MFKQVNQIGLLRRAQEESKLGFEFHYVIMKKINKQLVQNSQKMRIWLSKNPGPSAW